MRVDTARADIHPVGIDDFFRTVIDTFSQFFYDAVIDFSIGIDVLSFETNYSVFDDVLHDELPPNLQTRA